MRIEIKANRRRTRFRAIALSVVLMADGLVANAFGGPTWIVVLYALLGPLVGVAWLYVTRHRPPRPAPEPTPAAPPALRPAAADAWPRDETWSGPEPPASRPSPPLPGRRALGYARLDDHADAAALAVQRDAIACWCARAGATLVTIVHDTEPPGEIRARPSLQWALAQIAAGSADVLVVTRLQDLSVSVANLGPLLQWFAAPARSLVAIDLGLDTSTHEGRLAADAVAGVGGWEHERLSARTRRGLEAARSRGNGQGRAAVADVPELHVRIASMREDGMTLQAIADALNEEGVPTLRGGAKWRPSSVQRATGYRRPTTHSRGIELPRQPPALD
jgi:DNA invertase Pin-like site-specific DNA recombinase